MQKISGANILIVGETPQACDLRARLVEGGANVHVVSVAGAMQLIRCKEIDGAFVAAGMDEGTRELCAELEAEGAVIVFVAPSDLDELDRTAAGGALKNLRRALRSSLVH